mmetsp:Transcript_14243/g.43129  ORF Transcript_14243/g.43129 Transcript_14243/m.43129 type:complete len:277 (-) Transcript_14243:488-1318(-)
MKRVQRTLRPPTERRAAKFSSPRIHSSSLSHKLSSSSSSHPSHGATAADLFPGRHPRTTPTTRSASRPLSSSVPSSVRKLPERSRRRLSLLIQNRPLLSPDVADLGEAGLEGVGGVEDDGGVGGDPGAAGEAGLDAAPIFQDVAFAEDGAFEGGADDGRVEESVVDAQRATGVEGGHDGAGASSARAAVEHAREGLGPSPVASSPVAHDHGVRGNDDCRAVLLLFFSGRPAEDEDFGARFAGDRVRPVGDFPSLALDHFAQAHDLAAALRLELYEV